MMFRRNLQFLLLFLFPSFLAAQDHLLISEMVVSPTAGEFLEIHNPTANTVDLSNYYITDATFSSGGNYYYNIVTGDNAGGGSVGDFLARFPDGASIPAGGYQTVAMNGANFVITYATSPTYELHDTDGGIPDMREPLPGSINGQGGISNNGEVLILFTWDGSSDLVQDVDYLVWGDKAEAVDKTGISVDGPDGDSDASSYLDDTAISAQIAATSGRPHADGESLQRRSTDESGETQSGGNGISGHDETSEDLATSFAVLTPTPNAGAPASDAPMISNVTISPGNPTSSDTVTVSATVTDDVSLTSVWMFSSLDGTNFDSTMMADTGGDLYVANINPLPENTTVSVFVRATDNDGLTVSSTVQMYTVIAPLPVTPIADIQANPSAFNLVLIEAVVTLGAGRTIGTRTDTYVQDGSGAGINVFSFDPADMPPNNLIVRGNLLRITGTVTEFSGITEIIDYSIELVSENNPIPAPQVLSTQGATNLTLEGTYVETTGTINDIFSVGGGTNITIDDGSGPVVVRVWDNTNIDISSFSLGGEMTARAVMGVFNNTAQLVPGYQDELSAPGINPGDGSGTATITPDSVGTSQPVTATVTINGDGTNELESVSVSVPNDWTWSNSAGDVAISGAGFSGAAVNVSGRRITLSGAAVTDMNNGTVTISNLTSTANNTISAFTVQTATAGGTLRNIAIQPAITVGAGGPPITPIADIQNNPSAFGTVTIEGVVTVPAGATIDSRTDAYIQDNSGLGINVFSFDSPTDPPHNLLVRGNRLRITGDITEFSGVTEITDYSIDLISQNNPLPAPLVLSTNGATDLRLEGTRVQVTGLVTDQSTDGSGTNLTVDDGSGGLLVRIWNTTGIDISFIQPNDTVTVTAVIDIFSNAAQLIPAVQADISLPGQTITIGDGEGFVTLDQNSVAAGASGLAVTAAIASTPDDTLRTVELRIPYNWGWSGSTNDLTLSGPGLSGATASIGESERGETLVVLNNCFLLGSDSGFVEIRNLSSPDDEVYSYFWAKTAVENGTPKFIESSPRIAVGNNPIHQMRDVQINWEQFTQTITLRGVVTVGASIIRTDRLSAFFQDFSGSGININEGGTPNPIYRRGYLVEVTGNIDEFGETTQMNPNSVTVLDSNLTEPPALELTTGEAFSPIWDGTLIQVNAIVVDKFSTNPTAANPDFNLVLNDGSGPISARIWGTTGIDLSEININDAAVVKGIGNVFVDRDGVRNYQLLPGYQDHIAKDPTFQPTLEGVSLEAPPHPFVPDRGETMTITYNGGSVNNQVTIRIFDLGGRVIKTLVDERISLVRNSVSWDGLNRLRERVPLGTYICLLEVVEQGSGDTQIRRIPIVVGTVLK